MKVFIEETHTTSEDDTSDDIKNQIAAMNMNMNFAKNF